MSLQENNQSIISTQVISKEEKLPIGHLLAYEGRINALSI